MRTCDTCGRPLRGGTCWRCESDGPAASPAAAPTQPGPSRTIYFLLGALVILSLVAIKPVWTVTETIANLDAWRGDELDLFAADAGIEASRRLFLIMVCVVAGLRLWYARQPASRHASRTWAGYLLNGALGVLLTVFLASTLNPKPAQPVPTTESLMAHIRAGKPGSLDADVLARHHDALLAWARVELALSWAAVIGGVAMLVAAVVVHRKGRGLPRAEARRFAIDREFHASSPAWTFANRVVLIAVSLYAAALIYRMMVIRRVIDYVDHQPFTGSRMTELVDLQESDHDSIVLLSAIAIAYIAAYLLWINLARRAVVDAGHLPEMLTNHWAFYVWRVGVLASVLISVFLTAAPSAGGTDLDVVRSELMDAANRQLLYVGFRLIFAAALVGAVIVLYRRLRQLMPATS